MGFKSFKTFQELQKRKYVPKRIGFPKDINAGDINRLNSRVRIAREFDSIVIKGLGREATLGYEAFFRVFLTHSALERFLKVVGYDLSKIADKLEPHGVNEVFETIQKHDANRKLYDFLISHLVNEKLVNNLTACYDGKCKNTAYVSAAIRHTFAHGHLSAQSNGINPKSVHKICSVLSTHFLLFMDYEFTMRVEAGMEKANKESSASDSSRPPKDDVVITNFEPGK